MAASRVKNVATAEDVRKITLMHFSKGQIGSLSYRDDNPESVTTAYKEFIVDLLYSTPRPTATIMTPGLQKALDQESPNTVEAFSRSILRAIAFCREKSNQMSSGAKLHPGVKEICEVIRKVTDRGVAAALLTKRSAIEGAAAQPGWLPKARQRFLQLSPGSAHKRSPGPGSSSKKSATSRRSSCSSGSSLLVSGIFEKIK